MMSQVASVAAPSSGSIAEQHADRGRHALAALEAEEHRPEMAEERGERDQRDRRPRRARSAAPKRDRERHRHVALQRVEHAASATAAALLPERSTLVAPGLPEP